MNYLSIMISILLLSMLWFNYYQTGCWVIGTTDNAQDPPLFAFFTCGISGFVVGLLLTALGVYQIKLWLKGRD